MCVCVCTYVYAIIIKEKGAINSRVRVTWKGFERGLLEKARRGKGEGKEMQFYFN